MAYASSGFECGGFVAIMAELWRVSEGQVHVLLCWIVLPGRSFQSTYFETFVNKKKKKNPLVTFITLNAGRLGLVFFLKKQEIACVSETSKINSFLMLIDGTFRGFLWVHKLHKEEPPCFVSSGLPLVCEMPV